MSPKDPRFLDITSDEILKDYFLDRISEKPAIELNEILKDKTADDEWVRKQQQEILKEELDRVFKKPKEDDFEEEVIKDSV